jgi:hypothetical protein
MTVCKCDRFDWLVRLLVYLERCIRFAVHCSKYNTSFKNFINIACYIHFLFGKSKF